MNTAIKIALASAMSVASLSGVALAQTATTPMVDSGTTASTATDGVTIIRLDSLDNDQGRQEHTRLEALAKDQSAMAAAQSAVSSDATVMSALQAQSIEAMNVIDVQTAANGGKIVYVK